MQESLDQLKSITLKIRDACDLEDWESITELERQQKEIIQSLALEKLSPVTTDKNKIQEILQINKEVAHRIEQKRNAVKDELIGNRRNKKNINAYTKK